MHLHAVQTGEHTMKFKNKGRKIYKTKEKNYYGKSPVGKAFSVGLTILLIGGIGFIGYSVAEPVINYTKKKGDKEIVNTEATSTEQNSDENSIAADGTGQTVSAEQYRAYSLTPADLYSTETLKSALKRVPAGENIEYVEVPLKIGGGKLYYASSVNMAKMSGAVQSQTALTDIVSAIEGAGYKPTAYISLFDDNIIAASYPETAYVTIDDGSMWIDNNLEDGGKPWLSPFSDAAVNYNFSIVQEAAEAGFDKVVCADFVFPEFRQSDIGYLGESVVANDRYMALTSAANVMYGAIVNSGSSMMIEVSAAELLKGHNEILQPMLLNSKSLILNINLDVISYGVYTPDTVYEFDGTASDNVDKMLRLLSEDLSEFNVSVRISGESVSISELVKAKEKISSYGYSSFVIG